MDRRSSKRRTAVLVALAAATVWVAFLHSPPSSHPTPTTEDPQAETGAAPVGPTRVVHGVPEGWRHDSAGALAAAVSATHLTGPIAKAGFITRGDMIDQLASTGYGPELEKQSSDELANLLGDAGERSLTPGELLWDEIPLTATVTSYTPGVATVRVWTVLVAGAPKVGVPQQAWRTVTVTLRWQSGDWKVDNWSAAAGPTPQLPDGTAAAGFTDLARVTDWPSAPVIAGRS